MFHIVYLTTNLVNNKIYIGVRSSINIESDTYIGSGDKLKLAIKKYGKENFKRQILYYCLESKDAYEIESQIVNNWFVNRRDTYNCVLGGKGGDIIGNDIEKQKQKSEKLSKAKIGTKSYKSKDAIEKDRIRFIEYNKINRTGNPSTIQGKICIYNEKLDKINFIDKDANIPEGYIRGRRKSKMYL